MQHQIDNIEARPRQIAYPDKLAEIEHDFWKQRAESLLKDRADRRPTVGFGLSGGGIRSATFCLGIFQSLAKSGLLKNIDYLSTVSGGGFFASFYGRMFAHKDVDGFDDISKILSPNEETRLEFPPDQKNDKQIRSWKTGVFRWLRENGRYLAPNGSGDLLIGITVFLRNWMTIQLICSASILGILFAAQIVRTVLPDLPFGESDLLWLSPYFYLVGALALFGVVPLGWAYWAFAVPDPGESTTDSKMLPSSKVRRLVEFGAQGLLTLLALTALLLAIGYRVVQMTGRPKTVILAGSIVLELCFLCWQFALFRANRPSDTAMQNSVWQRIAFILTIVVSVWATANALSSTLPMRIGGLMVLGLVAAWFWWIALPTSRFEAINQSQMGRDLLSRWLRTALLITLVMLGFATIDSVGQMAYALSCTGKFNPHHWISALFAAAASIVPFAQSIIAFFRHGKRDHAPLLSLKLVAGVGAAIVILPFIISLDGVSHAVAYNFACPQDAPLRLRLPPPANQRSQSAPACPVGPRQHAWLVTISGFSNFANMHDPVPSLHQWITETRSNGCRDWRLSLYLLVVVMVFNAVVGSFNSPSSWVFLNRTSLHALYSARLIRAYLGASNKSRYVDMEGVSDPVNGDDIPQEEYWRPAKERLEQERHGITSQDTQKLVRRAFWAGATLHIVNITINETLDGSSQTEQRDRRGVGMAIGPAGFSLGVQHHVVFTEDTKQKPSRLRKNDEFSARHYIVE